MRETQTEIRDNLKPQQFDGFISTGSAYITVTSSGIVRSVIVQNPKRGPYKNADADTYLEMSLDGGLKWYTLARGDRLSADIRPTGDAVLLRTNTNGAGYQMIMALEC